ncbi:MAG: type III-A CRISPR-associated protein Cas10/Csm1 [Candidatus Woesearchaeota archaeon]
MKNYFEDENYVGTILAALLHDIGKYAQKFGVSGKHEEIGFSVVNGTKANEKYSIIYRYFRLDQSDQNLIQSAKIVKIADWLASSERHSDEDQRDQNTEKRLINILSEVKLSKNQIDKIKFSKNVRIDLTLEDIPKIGSDEDKTQENYWNEFKKEIEDVLDKDYSKNEYQSEEVASKRLIRRVSDLLKRYTSFSTSAWYYSKSDISLYAHSKITSAISSCLYILNEEGRLNLSSLEHDLEDLFRLRQDMKNAKEEEIRNKLLSMFKNNPNSELLKNHFVLIQGNFSGIQKFISTIYSKHALKMLKARSTYLSMLNELIPLTLVDELGLPEMNVIFAGGGNFEIIVPNTEKLLNKVKSFVEAINDELWRRYKGDLFLDISYKELSSILFDRMFYQNIFGNQKNDELDELIRSKLNSKELDSKDKKFFKQIKHQIESDSFLDGGYVENSEFEICNVCHKVYRKDLSRIEEDVSYCEDCYQLKILSEILRDVQKSKDKNLVSFFSIENEDFGKIDELFKFNEVDLLRYWNLLGEIYLEPKKVPFHIIPLGYPIKEGSLLTFEELAFNSEGDKKLAALKLDVDNLGKIFKEGLDEMSFSRYYQLSSVLDLFFKGYVPKLRNLAKYKDYIYIIFSGGDDAFFVGSWDKVLDFAFDLYYLFKKYSGNNPDLNISAAYLVFDENIPVYKIYEELEEMLEEAKSTTSEKNKINLCGLILDWSNIMEAKIFENFSQNKFDLFTDKYGEFFKNLEDEQIIKYLEEINSQFDKNQINEIFVLKSMIDIFYSLLQKERISRSFLHSLMYILQENKVNGKIDLPKIWLIKYSLVRNLKNDEEDKIKNLLWELIKKNTSLIVTNRGRKNSSFGLIIFSIKFIMLFTKKGERNEYK